MKIVSQTLHDSSFQTFSKFSTQWMLHKNLRKSVRIFVSYPNALRISWEINSSKTWVKRDSPWKTRYEASFGFLRLSCESSGFLVQASSCLKESAPKKVPLRCASHRRLIVLFGSLRLKFTKRTTRQRLPSKRNQNWIKNSRLRKLSDCGKQSIRSYTLYTHRTAKPMWMTVECLTSIRTAPIVSNDLCY